MKSIKSRLLIICAVLGVFGLIALFCFTQFEIVPETRRTGPSKEVRANRYFALEKWLLEMDYSVRTLSFGNLSAIKSAPEKIIFMEISAFNWTDNTSELIVWIEEGGNIIISLDSYISNNLEAFMKSIGVWANNFQGYEDENNFTMHEHIPVLPDTMTAYAFDWDMSFKISKLEPPVKSVFLMGNNGEVRLVKLEIGKGSLVFTGNAYFLHNNALMDYINVNLAGTLFFVNQISYDPYKAERGALFIRSLGGQRQFFGNFIEKGNPYTMAVSLVLLIITGFWMVIPLFGRNINEPEKPGKPLRERFLAEGRFLKKNKALGTYLEIYKRELGLKSEEDARNVTPQKSLTIKQFMKEQKDIMEKLEKIKFERRKYELYH